ncbi:hypothetical protein BC830DRAFT_722535 [Chytriomyces sp. MP71]|nr:hypothetical protein BC830DRAFT_722535 [Chytriomyces sp. MP71]
MLVEHVMRNVAREKVDPMDTHFDVVLVQRLSTYFTEILNFETPDPIVLRFLMSALVCIAEVSRDDTLLLRCIEKIVNCVTFTLPDEVNFLQRNAFMREETRQLRMKAASALVKLAVALPDVLINLFDRFVIIIQSFVHDGKVIPFERVKLIEFLLALIHHSSKSMPEKQIMFGRILGSYVHEWEALDESAFSSVGALIEALGVSRIAVNGQLAPAELTAIETWRQKVNVSVRAWMMWMKRTDTKPSLWPQYVYRILPKILVIVRAIHELSDPTVWVNIPANLHINTSISEGMKEAILKKSNITAAKGASNDFKGFMTTIESWVAGIREACYTIIGTLTSIGPTIYAIPNISSILLGCIFGRGAAHLSTRHWKSLVSSIVRPLLVHCPPDARANIFNVIFPHFSRFLDEKLKTEWNTLELAKQGAVVIDESGEDDEVNEEVVAEKLLRDLTRTYADLLTAIASPNEGKPVSKREEETMSDERSLNCYVISDQAVFSSVFQCLLTVMLLKDTVASRKSILCIVKSVPLLVKMMRADVMQFLGDIVMRACLEVFHDGYFQEVHNEAIVLMSDIYAFLREHNSPVAYQTLLSLPGMSSDSVQAFDNAFMLPHKTKREKHVIIKDFLKNIRGASVSEAFKQFDGKAKARPLFIRNTKSRDVLNDPDDPAAIVLGDFF